MKSILKDLINNKIVILSIFDIAIVFWILWYESGIQYEPLLEVEYNILSGMGLPTIPLSEAVYNTIIVAIVVNMIVLIIESKKRYKRKYNKNDLIVAFIYFLLIMSFMLLGSFIYRQEYIVVLLMNTIHCFDFPSG